MADRQTWADLTEEERTARIELLQRRGAEYRRRVRTERWEDFSVEERAVLEYADVLALRADGYTRAVDALVAIGGVAVDSLAKWAAAMEKRYGPTVLVWRNEVPWLQALLIGMYGEEPAH